MKTKQNNKKILLVATLSFLIILSLKLSIAEIQWGNEAGVTIGVTGSLPQCMEEGNFWWRDGTAGWRLYNSSKDCYRADVFSGDNSCCPNGYICDLDSNECVVTEDELCSEITDPDLCVEGTSSIAVNEVENFLIEEDGWCNGGNRTDYWIGTLHCSKQVSSCECYWNIDENKCNAKWTYSETCTGTSTPIGHCYYSNIRTEDKCDTTGYIVTNWIAEYILEGATTPTSGEHGCDQGPSQVKCLSTAILSFFGVSAVIIVIILIVIFYILKKKKSNLKKKKK